MAKNIGRNTISWRTFEKIFLGLQESQFPFKYDIGLTYGQAISLAQNLNKCQVQWEAESGVPQGFNTKSAKAKMHTHRAPGTPPDYNAPAYVEVSLSPRRAGLRGNPATQAKLEAGLATIPEPELRLPEPPGITDYHLGHIPMHMQAPENSEPATEIPEPPDTQDALLAKWYQGGE